MTESDYTKLKNFSYIQENKSTSSLSEVSDEQTSSHFKRYVLPITVSLLCFIASWAFQIWFLGPLTNSTDQNKDKLFLFKLIFYCISGGYILCLIWIFFNLFVDRFVSKTNSRFWPIIIRRKGENIILSVFLFFLYFFISTYEKILLLKNATIASENTPELGSIPSNAPTGTTINPNATNLSEAVEFDFKTFLIENFSLIILGISLVIFLFLIKSVIIEGIDYMLYWSTYFQKIIQTNRDIQVLYKINKITGEKMSLRSQDWIKYVFSILSPHQEPLTEASLQNFFSKQQSKKIMELFDERETGEVTQEQFVSLWLEITNDKREIKHIIENKNLLLAKLDTVLLFVFIPLVTFVFMSIIGKTHHFKTYGSIVLGFLLPLSFIFGSVIGELFKSIIFVFFIRPFEVGDMIQLGEKIYKVEEIGLLHTSFLSNSLHVIIPNKEIMSKDIINFRRSEITEKKYQLQFRIDFYTENIKNIQRIIKKLLAENPRLFKKNYKLQDVVVKGNNFLEITLIIFARLHMHNFTLGIDQFSIKLDQEMSKLKDSGSNNKS